MIVGTDTPFAYLIYANEDARARLFDILIVKGTYRFNAEGHLEPDPEQEPLNFTDGCYGAVNETSLRRPSDLVPYKPATDVIVNAVSCAPGGAATERWSAGLAVGDASWDLDITGPRYWTPARRGRWTLTDPEPTTRVPLTYEMTYGGEYLTEDGEIRTDERNPLGRGFAGPDIQDPEPIAAPQVLWAGTALTDPSDRVEPASLGAIPPAWLPRRPLGGTYDEDWLANTWPHWATDYDFAFHNSANPRLIGSGHLSGSEIIRLTHLHPEAESLRFRLPGDEVLAAFSGHDGRKDWATLRLDTVLIDLVDRPLSEVRIQLTWRMPFLGAEVASIDIRSRLLSGPGLPPQDSLPPPPTPFDLFDEDDEGGDATEPKEEEALHAG